MPALLLTNPLNSGTKLQTTAVYPNKFSHNGVSSLGLKHYVKVG